MTATVTGPPTTAVLGTPADCGYTLTREVAAPVATVWRVWTEPDHFAAWFHAPRHTVALDVRTGGSWAATIVGPDGSLNRMTGGYEEVVDQHLIVATIDVPFVPEPAVMSVSFTARGGRTTVVIDQVCGSPAEREMAERGSAMLLDWFAAYLATV